MHTRRFIDGALEEQRHKTRFLRRGGEVRLDLDWKGLSMVVRRKLCKPSQSRSRSKSRRLPFETLESRTVLDSTLVINEIMYHPATAPLVEGDYEWVEFFNQMAIRYGRLGLATSWCRRLYLCIGNCNSWS